MAPPRICSGKPPGGADVPIEKDFMIVKTTPWIFGGRINPKASCRLFCLPHSGSGASQFSSWQKFLPPALDICPVQLPGRENRYRETPFTQILPIARNLAEALEPYLGRPYILYGYSWGALIAFELARELRRQKAPLPISLYTLAQPAPHLPQTRNPLHQLPDDKFVAELTRRYNGMSPVILNDRELMQLILPTLRADVTALETYVYQDEGPLDCPIRAFGGRLDETATENQLRAWQRHTNSSFELEIFPGDHFFIRDNQPAVFKSISNQVT
jgi:medium-chain acyl-[acyl-carrier-protein] hydrolase